VGAPTPAEEIDRLPNDYQRALFCRRQSEFYRRGWFAGCAREVARLRRLAEDRDPRFRDMTTAQLEITARWRWSQSAKGNLCTQLEHIYAEWTHMYLAFAELEALHRRD
jgi:hypothetical protein